MIDHEIRGTRNISRSKDNKIKVTKYGRHRTELVQLTIQGHLLVDMTKCRLNMLHLGLSRIQYADFVLHTFFVLHIQRD